VTDVSGLGLSARDFSVMDCSFLIILGCAISCYNSASPARVSLSTADKRVYEKLFMDCRRFSATGQKIMAIQVIQA
jgi:hypothetical protein